MLAKLIVLVLPVIVAAKIFLMTETGKRVDERVRNAFSGIEASKKWYARTLMFLLGHPLYTGLAILILIGVGVYVYDLVTGGE